MPDARRLLLAVTLRQALEWGVTPGPGGWMSDPQFAAFRAAVADRFESRLKLAEEAEPPCPARRDSLPADVGVTIDRLLRRPPTRGSRMRGQVVEARKAQRLTKSGSSHSGDRRRGSGRIKPLEQPQGPREPIPVLCVGISMRAGATKSVIPDLRIRTGREERRRPTAAPRVATRRRRCRLPMRSPTPDISSCEAAWPLTPSLCASPDAAWNHTCS